MGNRTDWNLGTCKGITAALLLALLLCFSSCASVSGGGKQGQPQGQLASVSTIDFGTVTVGTSSTKVASVTNTGSGNAEILEATVTGSGFRFTGPALPLTLTPGQSASISAVFLPSALGATTGSLSLTNKAPIPPSTIALRGTGVSLSGNLSANPALLNFGSVTVGASSTQNVTLTNDGGSKSITISAITISGPFGVSGATLPVTLSPAQSLGLEATFTPTASGAANGLLTIVSTAANSPNAVVLAGTATTLSSTCSNCFFVNQSAGKDSNKGTSATTPWKTLTHAAEVAPANSTINVAPGLYRAEGSIKPINNGITWSGPCLTNPTLFPGSAPTPCSATQEAILNGSKLLTSFSKVIIGSVTYWVAPGPSQPGGVLDGGCDTLHPMCMYPEDCFFDSKPLHRVASLSAVISGTCFFDYSTAQIFFFDNPTGHTVEASSEPVAFEEGPTNQTIRGFVIEKYANPAQRGAIGGHYTTSGWKVMNNEARLNHGAGIKIGEYGQVVGNYVHDNGQVGVVNSNWRLTFPYHGALIQNNEISSNNFDGFRVTWEAGGIKHGATEGVSIIGNYIHDNIGSGIWCDGACSGALYQDNLLAYNLKNAIGHEISHSLTITGNVLIGNGFGNAITLSGAGITIASSDHVDTFSNFLANNHQGIHEVEENRTCNLAGVPYTCDLNNVNTHDNVIVQANGDYPSALYQEVGNDAYYTSKNNFFTNDSYCIGKTSTPNQIFWWFDAARSQAQWLAYKNDVTGKFSCGNTFISAPTNGTTVSGTAKFNAYAADAEKVNKLDLYIDGNLVTATTTTFLVPRTTTQAALGAIYHWDTTRVSNGSHTLEAKATNAAGATSSASITVNVQNP